MQVSRRKLLADAGLSIDQLACAQQVHSNGVAVVTAADKGKGALRYEDAFAATDALITQEKGLALAIFTADCLPIYLFGQRGPIIALVHAGWKSTKLSLVKKTIFIMTQVAGIKPRDITVLFGPAIRRCCYQVGEEFKEYFGRGIHEENKALFLDLIEVNRMQLEEAGVSGANMFDCQICTSCQVDSFFSFRKEKESCGRQMSLIMIE